MDSHETTDGPNDAGDLKSDETSTLDTMDGAEVTPDTQDSYFCPAAEDGVKDNMPACDYDTEFGKEFQLQDYHYLWNVDFGLSSVDELGDELPLLENSPDGQFLLLRAQWVDLMATPNLQNWLPTTTTGEPLCQTIPSTPCGGHCFPPQGYAYLIDPGTLSVVESVQEATECPPNSVCLPIPGLCTRTRSSVRAGNQGNP